MRSFKSYIRLSYTTNYIRLWMGEFCGIRGNYYFYKIDILARTMMIKKNNDISLLKTTN